MGLFVILLAPVMLGALRLIAGSWRALFLCLGIILAALWILASAA